MSSELGFLPAMYPFPCLTSMPQTSGFNISPASTSHPLLALPPANTSWERRCLRKHRRRSDDEGCSAKRRRLTVGSDPGDSSPSMCQNWPPGSPGPACPLPGPASPAPPQPCPAPALLLQGLAGVPRPPPRQDTEGFHMEVEAAQRRLQEIEERITLEDDDDDEDLDLDSLPRRPVLVMSDSLKLGLQRSITDLLPHTVAQSVSQSCMELVVWRPPEDTLSRRFRGTLQRQRKQQQQAGSRPAPAPSPPPSPPAPLTPTAPPREPYPPPGGSSGEEDMEL
ncbi:coiled-coil domain-containing protein 117 [Hypomesus transpacificus]|uniref:coiled-coil domain-containing protein 117 n=1 Tax=Hypomesus transpacificus TaxID=137520 RepID=UPI001F07EBE7|nr:coiled-coil domain-containing protein 117 [Hypomesus transpacificus]